jgi:hypothetical protein
LRVRSGRSADRHDQEADQAFFLLFWLFPSLLISVIVVGDADKPSKNADLFIKSADFWFLYCSASGLILSA